MKALRYLGPNVLEAQDVSRPEPGAGEVLLRVGACGICGSDVHGYLGLTGRRTPPMTMGHEFSGTVAAVGEGVTRLQPGDRVAPYPVEFCGTCGFCSAGKTNLCADKRQYGVLTVDGAFAEYLCVREDLCFPIADGVSFAQASMMEPLAVAYHAVKTAGDLKGKRVLIVGAGTIGLLALLCCRIAEPKEILVSDLSAERRALALKLGADAAVDPVTEAEKLADVDVAFEAVGAGASVRSAMAALRIGGTAVWIGNNKPMIELNMQQVVTRELKIRGSFLYDMEDFGTVVDLINQGTLDVSGLISREIPLEDAPAAFRQLAEDPGGLIKVVVNP